MSEFTRPTTCPFRDRYGIAVSRRPLFLAHAAEGSRLRRGGDSHAGSRHRGDTATFSIVDGVLLRPLPFPQSDRLVRILDDAPGAGQQNIGMSVPELDDLSGRSGIFEDVSAVWPVDVNITGAGHPERAELLVTGTNYFSLLGAHSQIGRVFGPQDRARGFAEAAVIGDGFWRRAFGGNRAILGQRTREIGVRMALEPRPGRWCGW